MNFFTLIRSYITPVTLKKYQSKYSGALYVQIENGKRSLNTDRVNYSFNSLHRIFQLAFKKTHLQIPDHAQILMLGLGAGSIVHIIRNDYRSKALITAVEIDPVMIEIARNEFDLDRYQPVNVILGDAYTYVMNNTAVFDVICVDIFVQDEVPAKFLSVTFVSRLLSMLQPKGKIYFNFMDCSARLTAQFNTMVNELTTCQPSTITELNLEENNRVLVVTK